MGYFSEELSKARYISHIHSFASFSVYAVGAGGEAGVLRCLEILEKEIDTTIALLGCADINELGLSNLSHAPKEFLEI